MNKTLCILLLACSAAVAQQSAAPAAAAPQEQKAQGTNSADARAKKARELIDQMIDALGGQAWLSFQTLSTKGRSYSFFHGKPTSEGLIYERSYQYPDKERRVLPSQREMAWMDSGFGLPVPIPGGKPTEVIFIYNGDKGWEKTYKGVAEDDPKSVQEFVRRSRHSIELWVRRWLDAPGTVLFYDGPGVADQQMVDMVTIFNKDNDSITIGIDINSHLPISRRYTWRDPDKYKVEDETIYGNYRKVQGIMTPYTLTNKRDGEINGQSFVNRVVYNEAYAPDFFDAKATYDREHYRGK